MPDYDSGSQGRSPGIQRVGCLSDLINVTPTIETTALDAGDVVTDTARITNAVREQGGTALWQSMVVYCQADQGAALDVYILDQDIDLGTLDAAPSITDGNALNILARVQVATSDYVDLGGIKIAFITNIGAIVKAEAGSKDLYLAAVTSGTPNYASASALVFGLGFMQD